MSENDEAVSAHGVGARVPSGTDPLGELRDEATAWFAVNWDPDLTLGDWWRRIADSGWGYPTWPPEWYGRGMSATEARVIADARRQLGALGAVTGAAVTLGAPTILAWGTERQKRQYLPGIVAGRLLMCQLFSEPGAGSDLASLSTRAHRASDGWTVTGQKVWSSGAHIADFGLLLARTDTDVDKHAGITCFLVDMRQPGITVRPIREMTGDSVFSEVFFDGARVPDSGRLGPLNAGWEVAQTTLGAERTSLGAGSMTSAGGMTGLKLARPDLSVRVGDIAARAVRPSSGGHFGGGNGDLLVELARRHGLVDDPLTRQDIARVYSMLRVAEFTQRRIEAKLRSGSTIGPEASIQKLAGTRLVHAVRAALLRVAGPHGLVVAKDEGAYARLNRVALSAPLWSIGGGTDEIQRTIIGERVLGLPREPRADRKVAFRDLEVGSG